MAKYFLTNKAVEDLNDIWNYTSNAWSEKQAEIYYTLLINTCNELAVKPDQGKSYEVITNNILGFKAGQHVIFYRKISENEIEVIRILHGMMDLKNHL